MLTYQRHRSSNRVQRNGCLMGEIHESNFFSGETGPWEPAFQAQFCLAHFKYVLWLFLICQFLLLSFVPGINHPWPPQTVIFNVIDPLQEQCSACSLGILCSFQPTCPLAHLIQVILAGFSHIFIFFEKELGINLQYFLSILLLPLILYVAEILQSKASE